MRFTLALIALSSALTFVSAQDQIPPCGITCANSAPKGDCKDTDTLCLCKNPQFVAASTACIEKECQGDDLPHAEKAAQAFCAAVGVTLTGTPTAPASGSATAASTSAAAAASSSAAKPSSSTGAGVTSSVNAFAGVAALFGALIL